MNKNFLKKSINSLIIFTIIMSNLVYVKPSAAVNVKFRDIILRVGNIEYAIAENNDLYENNDKEKILKNTGIDNVDKIVKANYTTYVIKKDGTILGKGDNEYNQISKENIQNYDEFIDVKFLTDIKDICGEEIIYGVKKDGTVIAWGKINNADFPVSINGLKNIVSVVTKDSDSYALDSTGKIYKWKSTQNNGWREEFNPTTPTLVQNIPSIKQIKMINYEVYAIAENGEVYKSSSEDNTLVKDTNFPENVEDIYVEGERELYIAKVKDGKYYGKGFNYNGELLANNPINIKKIIELEVVRGYKTVKEGYGIDASGNIMSWKNKNIYNQAIQLDKIPNAKKIYDLSYWGWHQSGQVYLPSGIVLTEDNRLLGYGEKFRADNPNDFLDIGDCLGLGKIKDVNVFESGTGRFKNYKIYVINDKNEYYQINNKISAVTGDMEVYKSRIDKISNPIKVESDGYNLIFLNADNTLIFNSDEGQIAVKDVVDFKVDNKCIAYIDKNGNVYYDSVYNLENAKVDPNVSNAESILEFEQGYLYISTSDNKLLARDTANYGNEGGQLGIGTTENADGFVEVKNINQKVKSVESLYGAVHAVLEDGTVMAWGKNNGGVLGLASDEEVIAEPQKVEGLSNIKEIKKIGIEMYMNKANIAITTDNRAYIWGESNSYEGITSNTPKLMSEVGTIKKIDGYKILSGSNELFDLQGFISYGNSIEKLPVENVIDLERYFFKLSDNKCYAINNLSQLSSDYMIKTPYIVSVDDSYIKIDYDVDGNGKVDIEDIAKVALAYNSKLGDNIYNVKCDFNKDEIIDIYDLTMIAKNIK